jgi:hypothetical protein
MNFLVEDTKSALFSMEENINNNTVSNISTLEETHGFYARTRSPRKKRLEESNSFASHYAFREATQTVSTWLPLSCYS